MYPQHIYNTGSLGEGRWQLWCSQRVRRFIAMLVVTILIQMLFNSVPACWLHRRPECGALRSRAFGMDRRSIFKLAVAAVFSLLGFQSGAGHGSRLLIGVPVLLLAVRIASAPRDL